MDQRQTFKNTEELTRILSDLKTSGEPASLLIDRDGLTRLEGVIGDILNNTSNANTTFTLTRHETLQISLKEVIAVNGIFRSDYTEC